MLVCGHSYLLFLRKVERFELQVLASQPMAGDVQLFALLNIVHGAEHFVIFCLDSFVLSFGVRVLVLCVICSLQSLLFDRKAVGRGQAEPLVAMLVIVL